MDDATRRLAISQRFLIQGTANNKLNVYLRALFNSDRLTEAWLYIEEMRFTLQMPN